MYQNIAFFQFYFHHDCRYVAKVCHWYWQLCELRRWRKDTIKSKLQIQNWCWWFTYWIQRGKKSIDTKKLLDYYLVFISFQFESVISTGLYWLLEILIDILTLLWFGYKFKHCGCDIIKPNLNVLMIFHQIVLRK